MKNQLSVEWPGRVDFDRVLHRALAPLRYRYEAIPLTMGTQDYIVVGISGATIPPETRLEISRTATRLVARYVYGDQLPEWMMGEQ